MDISDLAEEVQAFTRHLKRLKSYSGRDLTNSTHMKIQSLKERMDAESQQILSNLQSFPAERADRLQQEGLLKEFKKILKKYRETSLEILEKEAENKEQIAEEIGSFHKRKEFRTIADIQLIIDAEKENEIQSLNNDMNILNNIFKEVGAEVDKQGQQLEKVEENVESADNNIQIANDDLEKANFHHKKYIKRRIVLGILLFLILAIIIAIIAIISTS